MMFSHIKKQMSLSFLSLLKGTWRMVCSEIRCVLRPYIFWRDSVGPTLGTATRRRSVREARMMKIFNSKHAQVSKSSQKLPIIN